MNILDLHDLMSPGGEVATFHGIEQGANISFFVVQFSPGHGPKKHRHPYEETFIILEGEIEAIIDGETQVLGSGIVVVIPKSTWHEFTNCSDKPLLMINLHPVAKMMTEWG